MKQAENLEKISNADKQARFRKKEQLKREADKIYRLWEGSPGRWRSKRSPEEVRHGLDKAVELPSGWTDKDYEYAARRLGQYHLDLISSVDQIANDVDGDRVSYLAELDKSHDAFKFYANNKAAIENTWALASHMISALKLSACNPGDQAAAVMEVVRFVARSLVSEREIRCSSATATCLANIGPQYDRPDWFVKKFSDTIRQQIGDSLAHEIGRHLIKS
jgi:hypothetical protein